MLTTRIYPSRSITMYHLGTVKAMIESNTYSQVKVVSGTSGGR